MSVRIIDSPVPSPLTTGVEEFLKKRGERQLLGAPARAAFVEKVSVPPTWTDEERAAIQATQAKFDAMKLEDKGVLAVMVGNFIRDRSGALQDTPAGRLLLDGLTFWFELATEAGLQYDPKLSTRVNQARAKSAFARWDELLDHAANRAGARVAQLVNDQLVAEVVRLEVAVEATLADERELLTVSADQAQADATAARRELAVAQKTAAEQKQALEARVAQLEQVLAKERAATVNREREHRNEVHQLRQDLKNAGVVIGSLNRDCEQLSAQLAAPVMLAPADRPEPLPAALGQHSWVLFLRARGIPAELRGLDVHHGAPLADVDALCQEWRREIPTVQAAREQIRAAIAPILRGAA